MSIEDEGSRRPSDPDVREVRRRAFAARHAALETRRADANDTQPTNPPPLRRIVRQKLRPLPAKALRAIRLALPVRFKKHPLIQAAKKRIAQPKPASKARAPEPPSTPVNTYSSGPPRASMSETWRLASNALNLKPLSPQPQGTARPRIDAIVLNRNGAEHLRALFSSLEAVNTYDALELVLVDHGSTDDSRDVAEAHADRIKIRVLRRDRNYSFAHSNNYAAATSEAPFLLLLNNDIIFTSDVLDQLIGLLSATDVGAVGLDLHYPRAPEGTTSRLQHAGTKFYIDHLAEFIRPYNLGALAGLGVGGRGIERLPAVTAAALLMRREDYIALGGLSESFDYGYEDVDLCLRIGLHMKKQVLCVHHLSLTHNESATQRVDEPQAVRERRLRNRAELDRRFGFVLRRLMFNDKIENRRFYTDEPLTVGFAVTETGPEAQAGDYFTASELASALNRECGWETRFLDSKQDWYDLEGIDVVITMVDRYDLRRIKNERPQLLKVAWMRNWFERWPTRPGFELYDLCLCSSEKSAAFIRASHHRDAEVLRIATNPERFQAGRVRSDLETDYCFTGSYWNAVRDIEDALNPDGLPFRFGLFGSGWADHPRLAPFNRGFLPYREIPDVYKSSKVVVDDANSVTRAWASVNSRVFDALAAGALVLTNGSEGAEEVFGAELPTYDGRAALSSLLRTYLEDDVARTTLQRSLQEKVLERHTYVHRARELREMLRAFGRERMRIAIKIPAPDGAATQAWGDFHFALALRRSLWRRGHAVRIDLRPEWRGPRSLADDVAIVLRGIVPYTPNPKQVNILWNISHPEDVSSEEYESYDHVFVASRLHAESLSGLRVPVDTLLQCTDPQLFFPEPQADAPAHPVLFVGNSRRQARPILMDAIEAELPVAVYGQLWEGLIDAKYLRGEHVPNESLRGYYSRAGVVLNDHWPDMRDMGLLSNRLFDAGACGSCIISDPARDLDEVFCGLIDSYSTVAELKSLVELRLREPEATQRRGQELRALILAHHTFDHRAEVIERIAREHIDRIERRGGRFDERAGASSA